MQSEQRSSGRPSAIEAGWGGSAICFWVIISSRVPVKGSRPVNTR